MLPPPRPFQSVGSVLFPGNLVYVFTCDLFHFSQVISLVLRPFFSSITTAAAKRNQALTLLYRVQRPE
jgi:hypothetical protein